MQAKTVDYQGVRFYRTKGRNFYRPGTPERLRGIGSLHEEIWKAAHGEIPENHRIVHIDGDYENNVIDNLEPKPIARLFGPGKRASRVGPGKRKYSSIGERIEYNGVTYFRYPDSQNSAHRRYFKPGIAAVKNGYDSLHRQIWKDNYGTIPTGWHVHHKDGNTLNNDPENLVLLSPSEHFSEHKEASSARGKSKKQLEHLERIREKTKEWHRSEAGSAWHKAHGARTFGAPRTLHEIECVFCGKKFSTTRPEVAKYCSVSCFQKHARKLGKHKTATKTCPFCGCEFQCSPRQVCCSHSCAVRLRNQGTSSGVQLGC